MTIRELPTRRVSIHHRADVPVLTVLVVNSGGLSFTSVTVMIAVAVFERP